MSSESAIRIRQLGKCYQIYDRPQDRLWQSLWRGRKQFHREFWALRDVSFDIRKGETVGIIGRNGSGKSTLLQLIAGTLTPTTGEVRVNGRIAALLELGSGFNPDFTGRENVYMNAAILGLSTDEIDGRFDEIAAFADIGDFIDQPVKCYSSGMIVRLAFAVSVCVDPDILIVDEALAVGDVAFQFKCMERLGRLTQGGTTLLFVSHDMGMVKTFCKHAIYLHQGRIAETGTPDIITEVYLRHMRDEQRRYLTPGTAITSKPALSGERGIAFGTDQGHIVKAVFVGVDGGRSVYRQDETIEIRVHVEYDASLIRPSLALVILDRRHVVISGVQAPLTGTMVDARMRAETCFTFPANLAEGTYFVTLVLQEGVSETLTMPIDKQHAAMSFNVLRGSTTDFLGLFNLGIKAEPAH